METRDTVASDVLEVNRYGIINGACERQSIVPSPANIIGTHIHQLENPLL